MTVYSLAPSPIQRFVDNNGIALSGGKLFTYAAGTTSKLSSYSDSNGTQNTDPIILNTRGEASIWIPVGVAYKFVLSPSTDSDPPSNPIWTQDNILSSILSNGLTQNMNWFVNPLTGNDNNSGLTTVTAFATIAGGYAKICSNYTFNGFTGTINLAAGTYPATIVTGLPVGSSGPILIVGDTTTPANCLITTSAASTAAFLAQSGANISLQGVKIVSSGSGGNGLVANTGALVAFSSCEFGACANAQVFANQAGTIVCNGNFAISGAAARSLSSGYSASLTVVGVTVTITNTPAFSVAFAEAIVGALVSSGCTFTGSATGPRYSAAANGVIYTAGAGATYFPGNSGGVTATGGQYI